MLELKQSQPTAGTQLQTAVSRARDTLRRRQKTILGKISRKLRTFVNQRFRILSGGGSAQGTTWKPLTPEYAIRKRRLGQPKRLGVASKRLQKSSKGFVKGKILGAFFTARHKHLFSEDRPLMPDTLPAEWKDQIEYLYEVESEKIIQAELNKAGVGRKG